MQIKKIKQKAQSLEKILKIVESQKNMVLINILRLSQQIGSYFQKANQSKLFIDYLANNYSLSNPLIQPVNNQYYWIFTKLLNKKTNSNKTIWIYVTEEEKYETNSYKKYEDYLANNVNKHDLFICIGKRAINFATQNQYSVIFESEFNDVLALTDILPDYLLAYLEANGFYNIKFVLNSAKTKELSLNIVPLNDLNFELDVYQKNTQYLDLDNKHIYPDVENFVQAEFKSYLTYMCLALLSESNLIYQKYSLVSLNQKINDLEKKQKRYKLEVLRAKRELEVEQTSILSKKKDLLHENSKGASHE
ncbi:MSC_0622 family F1-like ATPase gamma subunit [Mycoplasmopsis verecunda]|uniref:ATP synthase gamma chain n=1 Tax=Mycoplasmopsis verecunda TaxID=171291 RepID=A0A1T4KM83_9BACT|nr:hypothetical protein [Mycoplasmopsis verecunda]WPB54294.1 hypothetical protein SAM46_02280 [Mycoplasmopsis verecunda]SJZ43498.1 hypothetical protein SAMN02745154_00111 [Mycoplasmopsis verecunda]